VARSEDTAIVYDRLANAEQLPKATDRTGPGRFRLLHTGIHGISISFRCSVVEAVPFPTSLELLALRRNARAGMPTSQGQRQCLRFVGVRPCELAAIQMQDSIFCEKTTRTASIRTVGRRSSSWR